MTRDEWRIGFYVDADSVDDVKEMIDAAQGFEGASGNYNYANCGDAGIYVTSCYFNYGETGNEAFEDEELCDGLWDVFDVRIF